MPYLLNNNNDGAGNKVCGSKPLFRGHRFSPWGGGGVHIALATLDLEATFSWTFQIGYYLRREIELKYLESKNNMLFCIHWKWFVTWLEANIVNNRLLNIWMGDWPQKLKTAENENIVTSFNIDPAYFVNISKESGFCLPYLCTLCRHQSQRVSGLTLVLRYYNVWECCCQVPLHVILAFGEWKWWGHFLFDNGRNGIDGKFPPGFHHENDEQIIIAC